MASCHSVAQLRARALRFAFLNQFRPVSSWSWLTECLNLFEFPLPAFGRRDPVSLSLLFQLHLVEVRHRPEHGNFKLRLVSGLVAGTINFDFYRRKGKSLSNLSVLGYRSSVLVFNLPHEVICLFFYKHSLVYWKTTFGFRIYSAVALVTEFCAAAKCS